MGGGEDWAPLWCAKTSEGVRGMSGEGGGDKVGKTRRRSRASLIER